MDIRHVQTLDRVSAEPNAVAAAIERPEFAEPTSPDIITDHALPPARRIFAPLLLGAFAAGLLASLLDTGSLAESKDFRRVGPILAMTIVSAVFACMWLAFISWRIDHDLFSGRMAIAVPFLFWSSQSISSPELLNQSDKRPISLMMHLGFGVVGSCLVACDIFQHDRAAAKTFSARLMLSLVPVAMIGVTLDRLVGGNESFRTDLLKWTAIVGFPTIWAALGIALLLGAPPPQVVLRRCVGMGLLVLVASQLLAPVSVELQKTGRAIAAGCACLVAALIVLGGLVHNLRETYDIHYRRLIAAEFAASETAGRLGAERLLTSRKMHDQAAALLSVEAVIKLLERSDDIDATSRHRLCLAATDELHRLRATAPERVEAELRDVVGPVVSLANAAGANVKMSVRAGLLVDVGPVLVDVVRNLISNALRHGRAAEVLIEAKRVDFEFLELSVTDNGPGVPNARRFDLFEPGRSSGGAESSGLGLHSARSLMREIGGDLLLDRSSASGARFIVRIPSFTLDAHAHRP